MEKEKESICTLDLAEGEAASTASENGAKKRTTRAVAKQSRKRAPEGEGHAKTPSRRGRKPREKDMPKRPLSAYNLFFKEERQRILADLEKGHLPDDYKANAALAGQDKVDGKRAGAAKFQAIARTIAVRWKALNDTERKPLVKMAEQEMEEYKIKKAEYNRKVASAKKIASAATAKQNEPTDSDAEGSSEYGAAQSTPKSPSKTSVGESMDDQKPKAHIYQGLTSNASGAPGSFGASLLEGRSMNNDLLSLPQSSISMGVASAGLYPSQETWNTSLSIQQEGDYGLMLSLQAEELRRREQLQREQQMVEFLLLQQPQLSQGSMLPRQEQQIRARLLLQEQEHLAMQGQQMRMQLLLQQQQQQQQQRVMLPTIEQQLREQELQNSFLLQQHQLQAHLSSSASAEGAMHSQGLMNAVNPGVDSLNMDLLSRLSEEERKALLERLSRPSNP